MASVSDADTRARSWKRRSASWRSLALARSRATVNRPNSRARRPAAKASTVRGLRVVNRAPIREPAPPRRREAGYWCGTFDTTPDRTLSVGVVNGGSVARALGVVLGGRGAFTEGTDHARAAVIAAVELDRPGRR